jgi:hypothetical protein
MSAPSSAKALQCVLVFQSCSSSAFIAQFHPQVGDSSPPWGKPMISTATTILSDRVQEHLRLVKYCLYHSQTLCRTPCFLIALMMADGLMLSNAPLMSRSVTTTNSFLWKPFLISFTVAERACSVDFPFINPNWSSCIGLL